MSRRIIGITVATPLSIQKISEHIKPVTSINGVEADENGNVKVNGVYTESDKAEIIQDVIASIPSTPQFTINGQGPDENGNFVIQLPPNPGDSDPDNNVVEFDNPVRPSPSEPSSGENNMVEF
jgi:hypothetical protein